MKLSKNRQWANEMQMLPESVFVTSVLGGVHTNIRNKKHMITDIQSTHKQPPFEITGLEEIREKPLDIGIYCFLDRTRFGRQDIDNVAKIIIDALKDSANHRGYFKDDRQIRRLLIQKEVRTEIKDFDTSEYFFSIREHTPELPMSFISARQKNNN